MKTGEYHDWIAPSTDMQSSAMHMPQRMARGPPLMGAIAEAAAFSGGLIQRGGRRSHIVHRRGAIHCMVPMQH